MDALSSTIRLLGTLGTAVVAFAATTRAESGPAPSLPAPKNSITVGGEGLVTLPPDQATLEFGVVTQAKDAAQAGALNAAATDRVLSALGRFTLLMKTTTNYSLSPNYRQSPDNVPRIDGYTANNTVRVKTGDLAKVGPLIDAATTAGANSIGALEFSSSKSDAARLEALGLAARNARDRADAIAKALGKHLGAILAVEEGGVAPPVPRYLAKGMAMRTMEAAPTPIEAGALEVRASVVMVVELGD